MGVTFTKKNKTVEEKLLDLVEGTSKNFVFMTLADEDGDFHKCRINVDTGMFQYLGEPEVDE